MFYKGPDKELQLDMYMEHYLLCTWNTISYVEYTSSYDIMCLPRQHVTCIPFVVVLVMPRQPRSSPHTQQHIAKGAMYASFTGAVQNVAFRMEGCMDP